MSASSFVARAPRAALTVASWIGRRIPPNADDRAFAASVGARLRLSDADADRLAHSITENRLRHGVVRALVDHRGIAALARWVSIEGAEHLPRPGSSEPGEPGERGERGVLVALWHLGVPLATSAALVALKVPTLMAVSHAWAPRPRALEHHEVRDSVSGAAFVIRAIDRIERGGVVAIAVDGRRGARSVDTRFLDETVTIGRGLGALAIRTGAPIVPALARFRARASAIDVTFHAPLAVDGMDEPTIVRAVADWFDARARAEPSLLRGRRMQPTSADAKPDRGPDHGSSGTSQ